MRAALYARVSTERQAERGTIGSQLALLREHVTAAGDELVGEYVDDGHSGARLDRPGLDALRDAAEAGLFEAVWCLSPDRLARAYAYQVLVLDELARFGVTVAFTDCPRPGRRRPASRAAHPGPGRDRRIREGQDRRTLPARQAVPRPRRRDHHLEGPLRLPAHRRAARRPARRTCEIYEPEAAVVRRIFTDRAAGTTVREICRQLNADAVPSPTGKPTWGTSTLCRLLRNEAYVGRVYYNRTESVPDRRPTRRTPAGPARPRRVDPDRLPPASSPTSCSRPPAASPTTTAKWSPRRAEPGAVAAQGPGQMRRLRCRHQLPQDARPQRHLAPLLLLPQPRPASAPAAKTAAAPNATSAPTPSTSSCSTTSAPRSPDPTYCWPANKPSRCTTPIPDDELLAAELARLDRKIDSADAERRRLVDLFQAGLIEMPELQRRATRGRRPPTTSCSTKRTASPHERTALAHGNQLRRRVHDFADRIRAVIDHSTTPRNSNCCACSSRTSTSPAGTSKSGCASHSTPTTRPATPTAQQARTPRQTITTAPDVNPRPFAFRR